MAEERKGTIYGTEKSNVKFSAKVLSYPCGLQDIVVCSDPCFGPGGWEQRDQPPKGPKQGSRKTTDPTAEDRERSMRRARAQVRRLALANDFRWFVTLTLDGAKIDRHDMNAIVKRLNAWCSNMVQRHGLKYILVPERHQDGAIHFHGFFNDSVKAVDSGTIKPASGGKPKRPRNEKQRQQMIAEGGHIVYNLPSWSLGFTTAIELYGEYTAAVGYVCKYIGKDGDKPAGRWYYSGGDLAQPKVDYGDIFIEELKEEYGKKVMLFNVPGKAIAIVNGIKTDCTQPSTEEVTK